MRVNNLSEVEHNSWQIILSTNQKSANNLSLLDPNIIKILSMWQRDAFFVIESNGKIIYANGYASDYFDLTISSDNLLDCFDPETTKSFEQLLEQIIEKNELIRFDNLELKLKNRKNLKADILLNTLAETGQTLILCVITPRFFSVQLSGENRLKTSSINIEEILKSESLSEIVRKITNLYPLTFIGKEIINRSVNQLEEFFWLKDNKGNYLIVNNSYAASLGLLPKQIEGKYYQNYLPLYMINFYNAIDSFIKETHSCVVLEGFPYQNIAAGGLRELIEFPLTDNHENVVALVGISRSINQKLSGNTYLKTSNNLFKFIEYFSEPIAFINSEGKVENCNKEFSKLFGQENIHIKQIAFKQIFAAELNNRIDDFLKNSQSGGIVIDINESLTRIDSNESDYKLSLTKYYRDNNQFAGFLIYLLKNKYYESVQQIDKSKGRMFEILIKNNPTPIFIYDKENLSFLEVNDAALKLYGYTRDEFLQMDLTDLYSPEDIQTLLSTSDQDNRSGVFSKPFRHRKKDGESLMVEISKTSFQFNDRDAEFNVIRDLTNSLEQDKKIQLFKTVFEKTNNLIFLTDPEGIITFVNEAVENFLKVTKREMLKTSLTSHCADEDRLLLNTSVFQSNIKGSATISVKLKDASNNLVEADLTACPILDFHSEVESYSIIAIPKILVGGVPGERKEIIREVVKEIIVEKSVDSNSNTAKQLDSNFLSGVFHEILTPMNVILGFAQELTEGSENMTNEQKEAADIINQNRFTLLSTMNSIIEFSDIHIYKSKLDINEIGITEVIEQLDRNIKDITGSQKIDFAYGKISSSLRFNTDKKVFESFVNNLVRLVSKITSENKVYFSAYSQDADHFLISVSDKYGTTSESLENTFKQLFLEARDPKELGVSKLTNQIIKSLLHSLEGKFTTFLNENNRKEFGFVFPVNPGTVSVPEIESAPVEMVITPSEKTIEPEEQFIHEEIDLDLESHIDEINIPEEPERFTIPEITITDKSVDEVVEETVEEKFSDPVKDVSNQPIDEVDIIEVQMDELEIEPKTAVKPKSIKELNLSELKCLYIEDQVDSQILFKVQMKGLKDIQFAVSFEEALPLLDSKKFDFIVMDINLQGEYNGLDALKIIHKMPGLENIPIVAVTAYVLPGDKEKFIATGFNDFISKPIFREKMVESLNKIFVN